MPNPRDLSRSSLPTLLAFRISPPCSARQPENQIKTMPYQAPGIWGIRAWQGSPFFSIPVHHPYPASPIGKQLWNRHESILILLTMYHMYQDAKITNINSRDELFKPSDPRLDMGWISFITIHQNRITKYHHHHDCPIRPRYCFSPLHNNLRGEEGT
jgi:hypothetical protein